MKRGKIHPDSLPVAIAPKGVSEFMGKTVAMYVYLLQHLVLQTEGAMHPAAEGCRAGQIVIEYLSMACCKRAG